MHIFGSKLHKKEAGALPLFSGVRESKRTTVTAI
jgi:hypothetical protein